jgi:L-threonylcarbamoyladenylate synthase
MKTKISTDIDCAVELLKSGEIVALPTETVYGLAGNALNPQAIAKIFAAKNRPQDNPLIVHISGIEMAEELGLQVPESAKKLVDKFWAGPLTIILKKINDTIPAEISCGLDSVAVRMPNSPVMLDIIEKCGFPLAAPSANLSGSPSPTQPEHVYSDLNGRIPLIINGGACEVGIESTVIMFDDDKIRILRPGAVTPEMLSEFAEVIVGDAHPGVPLSPGTRHKHYSPKAQVIAVNGSVKGFGEFTLEHPTTQNLFAKLREFDELGADKIYIRLPKSTGIGLALRERIVRAADSSIVNIYGLTGMSGAGKSTAAKIFAENGFHVIDCDVHARTVITSSPCIDEVRKNFPEIFTNRIFDRKKAAKLLFSNPQKLEKYQNIVFPYVTREIIRLIQLSIVNYQLSIVLDAPTLFQSGADAYCGKIIAVVADRQSCIDRIVKRDNIGEHDAVMRLNNQPDEVYFRKNCEYVIENNGSKNDFRQKIEQCYTSLGCINSGGGNTTRSEHSEDVV